MKTVIVTGGAGFIGSAVCRHLLSEGGYRVVNFDALTYAGNLCSLREFEGNANYRFIHADIRDEVALTTVFAEEAPDAVLHLAAESHVDRSIDRPGAFVDTNVVGTFRLLEAALAYWKNLSDGQRERFRFHHVSTDEVFGDLPFDAASFAEGAANAPSSPYAASKAASDGFVHAWGRTYGLPVLLSHCSNNYGPYHFPDKLIPLLIVNAIEGLPMPIYGTGENVRDWLYVDDHARALSLILARGRPGESYCVGGRAERSNLRVAHAISDQLDSRQPFPDGRSRRSLIRMVAERPGHDRRYAVDPRKVERELGWRALESFESALGKTVDWYLANRDWWAPLRERRYSGERLGLA